MRGRDLLTTQLGSRSREPSQIFKDDQGLIRVGVGERHDLIETEVDQSAELREMLDMWLRAMEGAGRETPTIEFTEDQLRQVRSLGYVK